MPCTSLGPRAARAVGGLFCEAKKVCSAGAPKAQALAEMDARGPSKAGVRAIKRLPTAGQPTLCVPVEDYWGVRKRADVETIDASLK